ncbi:RNA polymerase sigma factor [Phycicoccus sp. Soil803]|uniref:RNA polymerase sigma factor n=1 Tax=Phycicoccus sp. Soil803 TaxID=1736415 RepID=UPI00070E06AB|nr:sigma-70 family RNA polymerase sigma factor [Phycicoccus sp. Soil803]KRF25949.1 hypothetical protein ASG95_16835 [Phycicoccus sp. Soil803]
MSADPLATDLDLVERARDGSQEAVVELWVRHYPAALAAARRSSRQPRDAEELASDAFSNMLGAFASGGGPTGSVRAYLLTSVRNLAVTRSRRASSSEVLSDDVAVFEDGSRGPVDPMARQTEVSMMRQAFAALPRRWQVILWRTAVDHDRNIEIGQDLGISPNAVAALAKRARRGLRQAYLQTHLSTNGLEPGCEPFVRRLPMLAVDGSVAPDDLARHLSTCPTCPGRLAELQRVEQQLGSMLGPAVLLTAPGFLTHAMATTAGASVAGASAAAGGGGAAASSVVGGTGAAAPTAAGGSGATTTTSSLVAKLSVGKVVATAVGAAAAVSAGLLILPDDPPPSPPSAQMTPTTTPPIPSTDPPSPSPTETAAPTTTRETSAPRTTTPPPPKPSPSAPAPSRPAATTPSSPSPTPTRSPSTTVATTQLQVWMRISGPADATSIEVDAQAQGTTGAVRLTLRVPSGVVLRRASGDWGSCEQSGDLISCTAGSASGRWSGIIVTRWDDDASGRVTAEVDATYRNGGRVNASASASWPP